MKHLQLYFFTLCTLGLGLFTACSSDDKDESNPENPNNGAVHSYHIILENGDEFKGEVPKYTSGVFYYSAFVEHDEDANKDIVAAVLYETGKTNIGIGFHVNENNQPIPESNPSGISFNEWGAEKVYKSVEYTATLENYKKQTVQAYGEEADIASFTLHFEGTFANSQNDDIVSASGTITIAAP